MNGKLGTGAEDNAPSPTAITASPLPQGARLPCTSILHAHAHSSAHASGHASAPAPSQTLSPDGSGSGSGGSSSGSGSDGTDAPFFTHVSAGCEHSAAIDSRGVLYTWGHGDGGRLGHGDCVAVGQPTGAFVCLCA